MRGSCVRIALCAMVRGLFWAPCGASAQVQASTWRASWSRRVTWTGAWNPTPLVTVEFSGERNVGRLPSGRFVQTLLGNRLRINVSPDLSAASYVQYDTGSESVGVNTRLRWTLTPTADLFVVYNHNVQSIADRWQRDSNQVLIKFQYAWRL